MKRVITEDGTEYDYVGYRRPKDGDLHLYLGGVVLCVGDDFEDCAYIVKPAR